MQFPAPDGLSVHQLPDRSIVHGTLLYSTDLEALTEAIRPPLEKLQRHGVESVRQRVRNLSEYSSLHSALESPDALMDYLIDYFTEGEVALDDRDVAIIAGNEKQFN